MTMLYKLMNILIICFKQCFSFKKSPFFYISQNLQNILTAQLSQCIGGIFN